MPSAFVLPLCVVSGLGLIAVAIPLYRRRVPPNNLYGVRLRSTMHDEALWYDVNARVGRDLIVVGTVFVIALGAAQWLGGGWDPVFKILIPVALLVLGLFVETIVIMRMAGRMAAARAARSTSATESRAESSPAPGSSRTRRRS